MKTNTDPVEKVLEALRKLGREPMPSGDGWTTKCPGHDDTNASLSIATGTNGQALLFCHAGCKLDVVLQALGLTTKDLSPAHSGKRQRKIHSTAEDAIKAALWGVNQKHGGRAYQVVGRWCYHDSSGEVIIWVIRFEDPAIGRDSKEYCPIHKESGGWMVGGLPGQWPLYELPRIIKAPDETVFITEGEKAADAARGIGLVCTCSLGGAKNPGKTDWTPLAGRNVVLLPDNDVSGEAYALDVANKLTALTPPAKVKILKLPGLPPKGDIVEFIEGRLK